MTLGADVGDLPSFGRYQPVFRIAAGGMAEVYGARVVGESGFTRWVALKRILPELADDASLVQMFLDEARLAGQISSPNVVTTHDLGRASDGSPYLVMDLVVGATLSNLLGGAQRGGGFIPVPIVVEILAQAALGLHDAHEASSPDGQPLRIVHRDVSPRNILVGIDGRARILDFGIAQGELRATRTAVGEIKGTHAYFSPEQAALAPVDLRSDIYSLGVVAWEALAGRRLFGATPSLVVRDVPPRLESVRAEVSEPLATVVARALEVDRARRYASAEELATELRATMSKRARPDDVGRAVATLGASAVQRIQLGLQRTEVTSAPVPELAPSVTVAGRKLSNSRLKSYGTSFVGRERDLEALTASLTRGDGLVTLFGPGGIGKTRLAVEIAQRVRATFPGGVFFCDLTEARTAEGICFVVGSALGVPSMQGGDVASIVTMLADILLARPRTLLVLDNLEQAVQHVPTTLSVWCAEATNVTFLVTSRERLRIDAEMLYELEPLGTASGVGPSAAVQLFIDRARQVRPDLALDEAAEREIALIVRRLDGLPFAIELAASPARNVDLATLGAQLRDRFRALSRGSRDAVPRQATLDAAIRWSWDLLEPTEQALFVGLSVFHGGFDARAAAVVADAGGEPDDVAPVLDALMDKSLLRAMSGSSARFGMLESIREFASRELDRRDALTPTMERYASHFATLAAEWDAPGASARPADIEREIDNLVSAFQWIAAFRAPSEDQARDLLVLALAAEPVLGVRGPVTLAEALLSSAVSSAVGRGVDPDLESRARLALARALFTLGSADAADSALAEARLVALRADDRRAEAWVALTEAEQSWARGNLLEANTALSQAIEAGESAGDQVLLARAYLRRGSVLLLRGEHDEAREALEHAHRIATALRHDHLIARADIVLAELHHDLGDLALAKRIAAEGAALAARLGDAIFEALSLSTLGAIALEEDPPAAIGFLSLAQRLAREAGHVRAEGLFLAFVGVAQEAAGLRTEAHASLEASASASWRAGNQLGEALAQVYLGRVLARAGAIDEAEAALDSGQTTLIGLGDRVRGAVAKICAGHIDLARADLALLVGEDEAAAMHRARAQAVATAARREVEEGRLRSHDVRHALVTLESDLELHRDTVPPPAPPSPDDP